MLGMSLILGFAAVVVLVRPNLPQPPRWWQLGVAAMLLQVPVYVWGWNSWLLRLAYLLLVVVALLNRQLPGGRLICVGVLLNALPILLYGRMLISPDMLAWGGQSVALGNALPWSKDFVHDSTPLLFLGDVLPVTLPGYKAAWSMGDVVLVLGVLQYCTGFAHIFTLRKAGAA